MRILWQSLSIFWLAGEIFIAIATRRTDSAHDRHDRGTQMLLWIVIVLSLTLNGFLRAGLPAGLRWHQPWVGPISLTLLAIGLAVRTTAIVTLGRWFTANVVTHPDQKLQRTGLYGLVRHPSYLGLEIILLATGLHGDSWLALIAAFVPPTIALLYRIHVEETALKGAFGPEYEAYRRSTKRLIPGIY